MCPVPVLLQIAAGDPLQLSYGNLPNDFLLMDYGFVVPNNPHDRISLRFDIGGLEVSLGQRLDLCTLYTYPTLFCKMGSFG